AARMVESGDITEQQVEAIEREVFERLEGIHGEMTESDVSSAVSADVATGDFPGAPKFSAVDTSVPREQMIRLNERLFDWPADFSPHPRLAKQLHRRRDTLQSEQGVDWGHAELLAFASLV